MTRKHPDATKPYRQPKAKGPNGRGLCRWCWSEVPKGRRSWCSYECVADYQLHTDWNMIRGHVERRDRGVCAICGSDTLFYQAMVRACGRARSCAYGEREDFYAAMLGYRDEFRSPWEADHVVARSDGGEDHPRNLRTLCIKCHKRRTAEQRKRWAAEKRDAKAALFSDQPKQAVSS